MIRRLIILLLIVGCGTEPEDIQTLVGSWTAYQRINNINNEITISTDSTFGSTYIFNIDSTFTHSFWEYEQINYSWTAGYTVETNGTWYINGNQFTEITNVVAGEGTFVYDYSITNNVLIMNNGDFEYKYNKN